MEKETSNKIRNEFEAWVKTIQLWRKYQDILRREVYGDGYANGEINCYWIGWKAHRKLYRKKIIMKSFWYTLLVVIFICGMFLTIFTK